MNHRSATGLALAGYLLFVVYGSLLPLDYRALPLDEALRQFERIPFLDLGIASRADWVANGVLYLPLGFLATRWLKAALGPGFGWVAWALAIALCGGLAVVVEFAQLFFPPRTVSQNDLIAEGLGSLLGALLALVAGPSLSRLREGWRVGGHQLALRLLEIYALAYTALCFFPFDLLLTGSEVADKFASNLWGPGFALPDRGLALTVLQLAVEAALVLPIGVLLARLGRITPASAGMWGLLFGVLIEVVQFFVASGVSQGASVISRGVGVAAGAALGPWLQARGVAGTRDTLRRLALPALLAYLPLLLFASGWLRGTSAGLRDADEVASTWAELRWLPFYYHYYTTEMLALYSLGSVALMYAPLAVIGWARRLGLSAVLTGVLAVVTVIEAGKLFLPGQRPDPTNLIIALVAAAGVFWLAGLAERAPASARSGVDAAGAESDAAVVAMQRPWALLVVPLAALAWAAAFPVFRGPLVTLLLACAAAVWWRPRWALFIVPAALPLLDLAPWTGRFFWTEFDLLLVVCLAVAVVRTPPRLSRPTGTPVLAWAFAALGASLLLSALLPLWPWPGWDDNSFAHYTSAFNGLRIVKGAAGAALFVLLWRRLPSAGHARENSFSAGMLAGLAGTVAWVLWERFTYVGLLDFNTDYRVTGPFSAINKGGAYIECYLAVASAFAIDRVLSARRMSERGLALALLAAAGYAVLVTYSRGGYAAYAVMALGGLTLVAFRAGPVHRRRAAITLTGLALLGALAVLALPLGDSYARERLDRSAEDLAVRQAHWEDAMQMRTEGSAVAILFGEGLGRFPWLHYWRSQDPVRAAAYALLREGGATGAAERRFLRLAPGATLYIEQVLPAAPVGPLRLTAELRSAQPDQALAVSLCHKSMLTSVGCSQANLVSLTAPSDEWRGAQGVLDPPPLRPGVRAGGPVVKLSISTPASGAAIDVASLSLRDSLGNEWLVNGDFAAGMDRWFFATNVHPPWQVDNLPLAVWLDQGAVGVLAWSLVLVLGLGRGLRLVWHRAAAAPAALWAAIAFLVVGTLNTLIDEPRFLWLLLVLVWLSARKVRRLGPGAATQPRRHDRAHST